MKLTELRLPHLDRQHMVNALTFSRGLLALAGLTAFALGNPILGTSCFIAAVGTEIDGNLARRWRIASERGARLDAHVDSIFFLAAHIATSITYNIGAVAFLAFPVFGLIHNKFVEMNVEQTKKYLKSHPQPKRRKQLTTK